MLVAQTPSFMVFPARFLTWRAAGSIILQSEFWKTRTLVGPHSVYTQMLTKFPTIEKAFIQVISRQVIWQFSFVADGQSFIVIFHLWNYNRTPLVGSPEGVLALGLYSMELLLTQTPDTVKGTQTSYSKDKRKRTHPENKVHYLLPQGWWDRRFTGAADKKRWPWEVTRSPFTLTTNIAAIVIWTKVPHWSPSWNWPHWRTTRDF